MENTGGGSIDKVFDFLGGAVGGYFQREATQAQLRAAAEAQAAANARNAQSAEFGRNLLKGAALTAIAVLVIWRATR